MYDLDEIRRKVSLVAMAEEAGARFQSAHKLKSCCPMPETCWRPGQSHCFSNL